MKLNESMLQIGTSPLRDAAVFVGATILISWLFWLPGAFIQSRNPSAIGDLFLTVGSYAPLAIAFYLNRLSNRQTFAPLEWLRETQLRRVLVALSTPLLLLLPIILYRLYEHTIDLSVFLSHLLGILPVFIAFLIPAFGEEVGWRGFWLERLRGVNLALINLITGVLWFIWQLPLVLGGTIESFGESGGERLTAFFLFSMLITPFLNRLSLRSNYNVLLPTLLRTALNAVFAIYLLEAPHDALTHPYGMGVIAWLGALNLLLFAQLWLGKREGVESELERVMPLEPVQ